MIEDAPPGERSGVLGPVSLVGVDEPLLGMGNAPAVPGTIAEPFVVSSSNALIAALVAASSASAPSYADNNVILAMYASC